MKMEMLNNVLLVKKHNNTSLKADIDIPDLDGDKRLITGEIIDASEVNQELIGKTAIFGKYSLLKLTITGEDFYFLDADDIISFCGYKEN
jgi:co-chaperonin GroES (HSP10)